MLNTATIKEYAYGLGFDIARITSAEAFPEAEHVIKERIAQGLMDGLPWFTAERADVSCHPDALLPDARSIISLAMFYLTEQPTGENVGIGNASSSRSGCASMHAAKSAVNWKHASLLTQDAW